MKEIIYWIMPPLIGAIIGYITNAVAIKMLFRPLVEIRVFGLRLPFTPGIFPRERHKLAASIGRMVEQELLTPGVIRDRLAKTEVRENIGITLGSYTEQILDRPLSYWLEERPGDLPLAELSNNFVNSGVFDSFLGELIRIMLMGRDTETGQGSTSWIKSRLRDFGSIFVPPAKNLIKNGLVRDIKNQAQGGPSIYRQALESIIEKYPGITLGEFLSLGKPQKQKMDNFLSLKVVDTLDDNIEGALSSVNVNSLVTDRINSLDLPRVEKIILDVMAGQLKWINVFGAILGALIGLVQVIFSLFY